MIILPNLQSPTIPLDTIHLSLGAKSIVEPFIVLNTISLEIGFIKTKDWNIIYLETVSLTVSAPTIPTPLPMYIALSLVSLSLDANNTSGTSMAECELANIIGVLYDGGKIRPTPDIGVSCDIKSILDSIRAGSALPTVTYDPTDPLSNLINELSLGNEAVYSYKDSDCYYLSADKFPFPDDTIYYDIIATETLYNNKWRSFDTGLTWHLDTSGNYFTGRKMVFGGSTYAWAIANRKLAWKCKRKFLMFSGYDGHSLSDIKVSPDLGYSCNRYTMSSYPDTVRKIDQDNYVVMCSSGPILRTTNTFQSVVPLAAGPGPYFYNKNVYALPNGRVFIDTGANGQQIYYSDPPYTSWTLSYTYAVHPTAGGYPGFNMISSIGIYILLLRRWNIETVDGLNIQHYQIVQSAENGDFGSWTVQEDSDTFEYYYRNTFISLTKSDICDAGNGVAFIFKTCGVASPGPTGHDILKTTNSGASWFKYHFNLYDRMYVNSMCHLGGGILLMACTVLNGDATYSSYIYRSPDRGVTWNKVLTLRDFFARGSWFVLPDYNGSF